MRRLRSLSSMATRDDLKNFATKDDVREIVRRIIQVEVPGIVAMELKPVRNDLKQIEERLDALEQHMDEEPE